jgi:hypothetical protein
MYHQHHKINIIFLSSMFCMCLLFMFLAVGETQSQPVKIGLSFGPTSGTMKPTVFFDNLLEYGLSGYDAGLTVEVPVHGQFAVCLDVGYINKGFFRNLFIDTSLRHDIISNWLLVKRDYVQVPVYVKYTIPTNNSIWEPFVQLGISPAVNIKAINETVVEIEDSGTQVSAEDLRTTGDFSSRYRTWDTPLFIGTGVALNYGNFSLWTGMRYMVGLFSFVKDPHADYKLRYQVDYLESYEVGKYQERYNSFSFLIGFTININGQNRMSCCPR